MYTVIDTHIFNIDIFLLDATMTGINESFYTLSLFFVQNISMHTYIITYRCMSNTRLLSETMCTTLDRHGLVMAANKF